MAEKWLRYPVTPAWRRCCWPQKTIVCKPWLPMWRRCWKKKIRWPPGWMPVSICGSTLCGMPVAAAVLALGASWRVSPPSIVTWSGQRKTAARFLLMISAHWYQPPIRNGLPRRGRKVTAVIVWPVVTLFRSTATAFWPVRNGWLSPASIPAVAVSVGSFWLRPSLNPT